MKVFVILFLLSFSALLSEETQSLTVEGQRVIAFLAAEKEMAPDAFYLQLTTVEREVIRHQLVVLNSLGLLKDVDRLLIIRGAAPHGACGGKNYHRVLWVFKSPLREWVKMNSGLVLSTDISGPHPGTDLSFATVVSRPGMQFHTFKAEPSRDQLEVLAGRFGVSRESLGEFKDRVVEADIDYDWLHRSNPECLVSSFRGTVGSKILFFVRKRRPLFAETAKHRFNRVWETSGGIRTFREVRP